MTPSTDKALVYAYAAITLLACALAGYLGPLFTGQGIQLYDYAAAELAKRPWRDPDSNTLLSLAILAVMCASVSVLSFGMTLQHIRHVAFCVTAVIVASFVFHLSSKAGSSWLVVFCIIMAIPNALLALSALFIGHPKIVPLGFVLTTLGCIALTAVTYFYYIDSIFLAAVLGLNAITMPAISAVCSRGIEESDGDYPELTSFLIVICTFLSPLALILLPIFSVKREEYREYGLD